jgi:hypothetical protein
LTKHFRSELFDDSDNVTINNANNIFILGLKFTSFERSQLTKSSAWALWFSHKDLYYLTFQSFDEAYS